MFDCSDLIELIDSWLPNKFFLLLPSVVVVVSFGFNSDGLTSADCCLVTFSLSGVSRSILCKGANTPCNGSHFFHYKI